MAKIQRQVSYCLPLSEWTLIRDEAARRRMHIADLLREWSAPHMTKLAKDRKEKETACQTENISRHPA